MLAFFCTGTYIAQWTALYGKYVIKIVEGNFRNMIWINWKSKHMVQDSDFIWGLGQNRGVKNQTPLCVYWFMVTP